MVIIVDGYNVFKNVYKKTHITDKERLAGLHNLALYGKIKDHAIIVVFDGGLYSYPAKERHATIEVIYTGRALDADGYIRQYIERKKNQEIVVITSDNELAQSLKQSASVVIESEVFYRFVLDGISVQRRSIAEQKSPHIRKLTTREQDEDVDALMEKYGAMPIPGKQDDYETGHTNSSADTLSKHERKLLHILKKL